MAQPQPALESIPDVDIQMAPAPPPRANMSSRCSRAQDSQETRTTLQSRRKQRQKQRDELSYNQGDVRERNQPDRLEQFHDATIEGAARIGVVDNIVTISNDDNDKNLEHCRNKSVQPCIHGMPKASNHLAPRKAAAFLDHIARCHETVDPGQCFLMCFREGPASHYAVPIRCLWPDEYPHDSSTEIYVNGEPVVACPYNPPATIWETARKCNSDLLQRILDECYRYVGKWKQHIPFYGIVHLQFVLVSSH